MAVCVSCCHLAELCVVLKELRLPLGKSLGARVGVGGREVLVLTHTSTHHHSRRTGRRGRRVLVIVLVAANVIVVVAVNVAAATIVLVGGPRRGGKVVQG